MKTLLARLLLLGLIAAGIQLTQASGLEARSTQIPDAPTLGNYPNTSLPLSTDTMVIPDAVPTSTTSINVSTSTSFKGKLEGTPATGVVRVTNAHPAGVYPVTVRAFDSGGASVTRTFMLTVTTPVTCNPLAFATAAASAADSGAAPTVGDFNGDGIQDIAVVNGSANTASILLGNGTGSFGPPTPFGTGSGTNPTAVAVGDFNGDGRQDLATANFDSSDVAILLGDGAGNFGAATNFAAGSIPRAIVVGDFNGDAKQDLATANFNSNDVSILLGSGAGSFGPPTNFAVAFQPVSVAVGDFNGDGQQDLATANQGIGNISILLGNGAGSFSGPTNFGPIGGQANSVAVGDFNNDGQLDIVVVYLAAGRVRIFVGNGAGSFSIGADAGFVSFITSAAVGDFNGDGNQDAAVSSGSAPYVTILLGDGMGNLGAATTFDVGGAQNSVAVGDFNGDGMQDLATTNTNLKVLLRDCTLVPTNVVSRKMHGGAGIFDIDLPLSGLPGTLGVECRSTGGTNDHQLVVTYPGAVTVSGNPQAHVVSGAGVIGTGGTSNGGVVAVSGNTVTIPLTNVTNGQVINVSLNGVNQPGIIDTPAGTGGSLVIPMGVLAGDVDGSHGVTATDISIVKSRTTQGVNATTFRADVTVNGAINTSDIGLVKARSGTSIP